MGVSGSIRCQVCDRVVSKTRQGRRYCSNSCRQMAWRKAHGVALNACTYCGMAADTKDHVPPRSHRAALRELCPGRFVEVEVVCCRECNCLLGARALFTVSERRAFIRTELEKRYRKELAMPAWTPEELAAMGPNMRTEIQHGQAVKELTRRRLAWDRA